MINFTNNLYDFSYFWGKKFILVFYKYSSGDKSVATTLTCPFEGLNLTLFNSLFSIVFK